MSLANRLPDLERKYADQEAEGILSAFIRTEFPDKIALVSSFGIEAAVLLDMVAQIDRQTPVLFLDTGKLFPETLRYRDRLVEHLKLENVKTYYPDYVDISREDPEGGLWESRPSACCYNRKVKPLHKALKGFECWITGRKRFHGGLRADLPMMEFFEGQIKINPLGAWSADRIMAAFEDRALPRHPLEAQGYTSVGCMPCTSLPVAGSGARSGRWQGQDKTECGIHLAADGTFKRGSGTS